MTNEHIDPAEALALVQRSRTGVAAKVDEGSWRYDLCYSALAAAMVAGWALPGPLPVVTIALCCTLLALLARTWAQKTGVFVNGATPKRARWVAFALSGAVGVAMVGGLYLARERGLWWAPLVLAPVAFAAALAGSRLWRGVYRAETGGAA